MLLQCENDEAGGDCGPAGCARARSARLSELNEECLELCVAQARAGAARPLCTEIAQAWTASMPPPGDRRAAACTCCSMQALPS